MKFLFLTDTHLTARGPRSRSDNYVNALFTKLEEIKEVIITEDIDCVFHGGDMFDKPVVSMQLTGMMANFIKSTKIPWYVVPGNHDLFGYNLKSLPQTSLGVLNDAGVVTILDRSSGPTTFNVDGKVLGFEGQEYHMDIDKRLPELDYHATGTNDYNILIPHSMLLPHKYFDGVPHTMVENLQDKTDADLILVGHYHDGFEDSVIHTNGSETRVVNPGSVMRDEGSKGNLTRIPKYVILDWQKGQLDIGIKDFTSVLPGPSIFDRAELETKKVKNRYLDSFEQSLSDGGVTAVDVRSVLDELILNSPDLSDETIELSRDELEKAEKAVDDIDVSMSNYIEKPGKLSIESLHIKGFQSHEDTMIEFEEGLNAIVGPSDSGKTSIIRTLRFVLYNEPRGADFIRASSTEVSGKIVFSDGTSLERKRTRTSAGSYIVGRADGTFDELKGFTNQLPSDIATTHQMPMLQLAKDMMLSLNIGYQLDPPFMIGESPGARAAIIGRLTGANLVDTAVRESNRVILSNTKEIKLLKEQLIHTEDSLNKYTNLDEDKKKIDKLTSLNTSVKELDASLNSLIKQIDKIEMLSIEEGVAQRKLKSLARVNGLAPRVRHLEGTHLSFRSIKKLEESLTSINLEQHKHESFLSSVNHDTIKPIYQKMEQFDLLHGKLKVLSTRLNKLKEDEIPLTEKTKGVRVNDSDIQTVNDLSIKLGLLEKVRERMIENQRVSNLESTKVRGISIEIEKKKNEYTKQLNDLGVCPLCNQITST